MKTLQDALAATLATRWHDSKAQEHTYARAVGVVGELGPMTKLHKITGRDVQKLTERLLARGDSNSTVNRKLSALSALLRTAFEGGAIKAMPPIRMRKEGKHRIRTLTREEYKTVCQLLAARDLCDLVVFLMETGMRVSEALGLPWGAVSNGGDFAVLADTKNGEERVVPLTGDAKDALSRRYMVARGSAGPFSDMNAVALNKAWAAARRAMGITDREFVPHALRHTAATRMLREGISLPVIQKWLGHKSIATTMRYAHVEHGDLMEAVKKLNKLPTSRAEGQ